VQVEDFNPTSQVWDEELDEELLKHRLVLSGSALSARGQSASLLAPDSSAVQDLLQRALKDAKCPAGIVDGVEASAGGSPLSDAVELNILRRTLVAADTPKAYGSALVVRSTKSLFGDAGPPSGLAGLVRACFTIQKAVHGPLLHLRQLTEMGVDDDDLSSPSKLFLSTEAVEASCLQQTLGVSSFGSSGTSVHMLLTGSPPSKEPSPATGRPLRWFPASARPSVAEVEYFVIGSFNLWERPVKMEVESEGVFGFTLALGENRWETFQIWENADPDKVLHPGSHWADRDAPVLGPSRQGVCGRYATWRLSGKPMQVRFCNEEQIHDLNLTPASEDMLIHAGDTEIRTFGAFPNDFAPPEADGEMPVIEHDADLVGMAGDSYRIRLRVGEYRKVDWHKIARPGPVEVLQPSSYYVVGDFNHWGFQLMQEEASSSSKSRSFVAEVRLTSDEDCFQVVRNRDWDQAFYPEGNATDAASLRGPDAYGTLKGWRLQGQAGDVFRIHFRRTMPTAGADEKFVSWARSAANPPMNKELAVSIQYCVVGSWDNFKSKHNMEYDKDKSSWIADVLVRESGFELFHFLYDGNWMAVVYPDVNEAPASAKPCGPDRGGAGRFWRLEGSDLQPGDMARITLKVDASTPRAVSWEKIAN